MTLRQCLDDEVLLIITLVLAERMAVHTIELDQVNVQFNEEVLLSKVNLCIKDQESLVIIGPSGHGKSVLLKVMAGLIAPTGGRVLVEGQNINAISKKERLKIIYQMGMLFQRNALFDSLTVGENIAFPLREVSQLDEKAIADKVAFFLDAVGISHARDLFPDEISGGMQKRLGIARALALKPKIIFYDDPTAGLDPITSRKIIDLILDLKQENKSTLISITNDMSRAYQLADRILMVVEGQVLITGDQNQTLEHPDPRVHQFIRGELKGPLTKGVHS